jgi:hypothetical protein
VNSPTRSWFADLLWAQISMEILFNQLWYSLQTGTFLVIKKEN